LRDGDHVTVLAEVASVNTRRMRNRSGSIFEAVVTDGHGRLTLTFFGRGNQRWMEDRLQPGVRGLFSGQVSSYRGKRQLAHPDYELLGAGAAGARAEEYANEMIPIYPATAKLASWKISDAVRVVLDVLDVPEDPLPAAIREAHGLRGYADALRGIHRPADDADQRGSRDRLKWDEAFALQVTLAQRRRAAADYSAIAPPCGRRAAGRVRRLTAVRADRGPAAGRGRGRRRAGRRPPDEPAAPGRGRLGQDGDRGAGHAPGHRRGRPGGAAGPDRGAGPAALPVDHQHARADGAGGHAGRGRAGDQGGPADRVAG